MARVLLLAVQDSDVSERVLEWTVQELYREGDELHLFTVIPSPQPQVVGGFGAMDSIVTVDPDPTEDLKHIAEAKEFMKTRFVAKLASRKIPYKVEIIHYLVDNDSIGDAICKRADALGAAAVIMAKHQRGAVSQFFLGSVSRYTTTHCKQPVIVLH